MKLFANIALCAGTLTLAFVMLKVYLNSKKKNDDNSSNSQECEEKTNEDVNNEVIQLEQEIKTESVESKQRAKKRKIEETKGTMKLAKLKPNFFLAFQVHNVGIHKKVKAIQEKIISRNPLLYPALVNISTLHITLAVTHLANEVDIKTVKEKLEDWTDKNSKLYFKKPIVLNFSGIGIFNNAVAYVDLEKDQDYQSLCNLCQSLNHMLSSAGFSTDSRITTPHLTILKLSKDTKLLRSKKKFKEDFEFLKQQKEEFGSQELSHVQLLSMDEPKDANGYYKCFHQINLSDITGEMDHSECCNPLPKPKKKS